MTTKLPAIATERKISKAIWNTLKNSLYPGAKDESVAMVWDYCEARKLDVLKKVVHIVPMYVDDGMRDVIMPGIAELRTTAARTENYAGQDEPIYGEEFTYMNVKAPTTCKVTVYRMVQGIQAAFSHTERFTEAVGIKKAYQGKSACINSMWTKRPYAQLAKCAEAGALRKAFPEELGSTYVPEEMVDKSIDMGPADVEPEIEMPKTVEEASAPEKPPIDVKPEEQQEEKNPPATHGKLPVGAQRVILSKIENNGKTLKQFCEHFKVANIEDISMAKINEAIKWTEA